MMHKCEKCGRQLRVNEAFLGKPIQCPRCGGVSVVPAPSAPEEPAREAPPRPAAQTPRRAPPVPEDLPPLKDEPDDLEVEEEVIYVDEAPPPVPAEEDEDSPYIMREREDQDCPNCKKTIPKGTVVCVACGYNLRTRQKAQVTYERFRQQWLDLGLTLQYRLVVCGLMHVICIPPFFLLDMVGAMFCLIGGSFTLVIGWGTFNDVTLTRDTRGRSTLRTVRRIGFVPLWDRKLDLRDYRQVIVEGASGDLGMLVIVIIIALCCLGIIPGLIFWWLACGTTYQVKLRMLEEDPTIVYDGRSEGKAREIAAAIHDVAGLRYG